MLGQRILESYPDVEDDSERSSLLRVEPPGGLTIRRIKSAGLRIVTESEIPTADTFRDYTNTLQLPHRHLPLRTPDTSHTFGLPNPSMLSPEDAHPYPYASSPPSASAEQLAARRLSRYTRAESALRSAVDALAAEVCPHELQIRVLELATAMLSDQARDAQACVERLRGCLSDGDLPPDEHRSLQHERWLEEHRYSARRDLCSRAREVLEKMASPVQDKAVMFESPTAMTRQEANLATFMQRSPTRLCCPSTRSPTVLPATAYRRKTVSQVRPLRLRASAMDVALRAPLRIHTRSRSLDGGHSRSNSAASDATFVSQGSSGQTAVTRPSIPQLKASLPLSPPPFLDDGSGFVNIKTAASLRSKEELLAEVGDVPLPDYAIDLLEDLVASSLDISLQESGAVDSAPVIHIDSTAELTFRTLYDGEPSTPRPLGRLRTQSDTPPSPSRGPSADARPRPFLSSTSAFRASLHPPAFSSSRTASPLLFAVPEAGAASRSRPQTSLSEQYALDDASSAMHDTGESEGEDAGEGEAHAQARDARRFSVVSFRKLEREGGRGAGVLARFRRRLSALRQ
ncbi:hypothetical protein BD413DRAFT_471821 [Trametes elegans]|nr:hypothetical protein BD413DRAFT_471821 [Trametes elegans]